MTIAAVVEGYGDIQALPVLLAKIGIATGEQIVTSNPIRAGEWHALKQSDKFERRLDLAASRSCSKILVALDLDDGCAASEAIDATARIERWKNGREIDASIVFFVREYEGMFLSCPLCMDLPGANEYQEKAEFIRGAKEAIRSIIGRRYRETQDQIEFTRKLDVKSLYNKHRSFRKLCKSASGIAYANLNNIFR